MTNQTIHKINRGYALEVHGLTKSYGKVQALGGIDLEVQYGEIFGFLGPNGAGKTTTIRCLLDMIRPDHGQTRLLGMDPRKDPIAVQERTGYLPGEMQFYENMTVARQLRFFNELRNRITEWKSIRELADRLDLDLKTQIKNLSKGNKQKLGVIQALMHRPELLILDEPTSGLDPLMQLEVLNLLREANAAGTTVFFSSHIMSEVEELAERVAIIRSGKIIEVNHTKKLTHHSMRRLMVRFKEPIKIDGYFNLPGVEILSQPTPTSLQLQVTGAMEELIRNLGQLPVLDLETEHLSLEEVFLAYYKKMDK